MHTRLSINSRMARLTALGALILLICRQAVAQAPSATISAAAISAVSTPAASEATYRIHHTLTVKDLPKGTKKVRVWFWIPQEDVSQRVLDFTISQAPPGSRMMVDGSTGMTYLYSEVTRPAAATIPVVTDFTVCRRIASLTLNPDKAGPLTALHRATFAEDLRTDVPHMVVNASMRALADKLCGSETNVVRQARLIYDYVVDHTQHYSKSPTAPKSSNEGDADYCLANGGGACTDMHSLFCALARARGIPTRFCFGSLLKAKNEGKDLDPGYRCWVLFFVPNYGWVPADMAAANLAPESKDFYFGGLDARHLLFSRGRDLILSPKQEGPPVNLFIRGYVEVDGKPYTSFDRDLTFIQQQDTPAQTVAAAAVADPAPVAAPVPDAVHGPALPLVPMAAPDSTPPGFRPIPGLTSQYGDFRGQFQALTDPKVIPAGKLTELKDDEEVLGLTLGGQSRAYPARFIAWHHIINDTLGARPVVVTYCSICNSGVAYDPIVDGKRRLFNVFGLYRGVMAMVDPSTDTIWSHLAGEALLGPDKSKTLTALPVVNTSWGEWKRLHPATTTPSWDTAYRRYYQDRVVSGQDYLPPMFPPTLKGLRDDRLASNALVLAVRVEGQPRAYPFETLEKAPDVVQETLGTTPVAAFYTPSPKTAAAFDRRLDGAPLDFTRVPSQPRLFQDRGTKSEWTVEGLCVSGPLQGKQLMRLFSLQAEWYGWSAYFPQTTVYTLPAVVPDAAK